MKDRTKGTHHNNDQENNAQQIPTMVTFGSFREGTVTRSGSQYSFVRVPGITQDIFIDNSNIVASPHDRRHIVGMQDPQERHSPGEPRYSNVYKRTLLVGECVRLYVKRRENKNELYGVLVTVMTP